MINLGAYEPRWFMAQGHINPRETVRAFKQLGAKRLAVIHWGTFQLTDEPLDEPPGAATDVEHAGTGLGGERVQDRVVKVLFKTEIVVEDTHWMDEPSRGLLARMTAGLRGSPWLVILTRRPGREGYVAADEGDALVRIELQPLGTEQATGNLYDVMKQLI